MKRFVVLVLASALCFCSCKKEQIAIMFANQRTKIETYVNKILAADEAAEVYYNGGSTRVIAHEADKGEGDELNARGSVTFEYAGYDFTSGSISSSAMFATNKKELAQSLSWSVADVETMEPVTYAIADESLLEGLRLGLKGVKKGETCTILFTGDLGFGDTYQAGVPKNAPLAFVIWVKEIEN